MHLTITLPSNRKYAGYFTLTREVGNCHELLMDGRALGKSDNGRAIEEGNPTRDPKLGFGDTPTGDYEPVMLVPFDPPHKRLGKGWIPLEGISGDALIAKENGRWGLGFHAGRLPTDGKLIPTYGCVRASDRDFDQFSEVAKGKMIAITIREED